MTSSLVGSEMCIRDSHFPQGLHHCQGGDTAALHGCGPGHGWARASFRPCLLYTSDAADDM
eukprot:12623097-Prorocentrum_lima.AAC.1